MYDKLLIRFLLILYLLNSKMQVIKIKSNNK